MNEQRRARTLLVLTGLLAIATLSPAVQADSHREPQGASASQFATVTFVGAVVGLARSDGQKWEGGLFSDEEIRRFQRAAEQLTAKGVASLDPVLAAQGVVEALGLATLSWKERPDPEGTITLVVDGRSGQSLKLQMVKDTYQPSWEFGYVGQKAYKLTWPNVPLDHDVRLRVRLADFDPIGDPDNIGTVEINSDDLRRAAATRRVFPVFVGNQSTNQLMFVNVSVTMSGGVR